MTDETASVGNPDATDPSQESKTTGQQSTDIETVLKEVRDLKKQFAGLQKGTDKVNARVEERVNQVLANPQIARILELSKTGLSSEEIEDRLLLDEVLQERKSKARIGSGGSGSSSGGSDVTGLSSLVEEFGLDANDAAVAESLSKSDYAALARLAVAKSRVPSPDASTSPPLTTKESQNPEADKKALRTAYEKDLQKLKESRMFNAGSFAKLKAEYRHKGLDLH